MLIIAVVLLFTWTLQSRTTLAWVVTASCAAAGIFGLYEARKGWCAVRAMGFRTPI